MTAETTDPATARDQVAGGGRGIVCEVEAEVDYAATAAIGNESFARSASFSAARLAWLYGRAFGGTRTCIAVKKDGIKVGQAVILRHQVQLQGRVLACAQLVDLFVSPRHRSFPVVRKLADEIAENLASSPVAVVFAVPNDKSAILGRRLLHLEDAELLEIRVGFSLPTASTASVRSCWFTPADRSSARSLMQDCLGDPTCNQVHWTPDALAERLGCPNRTYVVHRTDDLCAITSLRTFRRMPVVLVCGLFPRCGMHVSSDQVRAVLGQASRMHRCPVWSYVGLNNRVDLPGIAVPERIRPSPMRIQMQLLDGEVGPKGFDRFETIDFDFA